MTGWNIPHLGRRATVMGLLLSLVACSESPSGIVAPSNGPVGTEQSTELSALDPATRAALAQITAEDVAGMLELITTLAPGAQTAVDQVTLGNGRVRIKVLDREANGNARKVAIGESASAAGLRSDGSSAPTDVVITMKPDFRRFGQRHLPGMTADPCSVQEVAQIVGEMFFAWQGLIWGDPQALADFSLALYQYGECVINGYSEVGEQVLDGLGGQWSDFKAGFRNWWNRFY